tara:strand:+ start:110 stop:484 length:375 start_codon:yes stop_codon:yes gene_type:complete
MELFPDATNLQTFPENGADSRDADGNRIDWSEAAQGVKTMDKIVQRARKLSGLARFERTTKGWKTPGTQAAGRWASLNRRCCDIQRQLTDAASNAKIETTTEVLESLDDPATLEAIKAIFRGAK